MHYLKNADELQKRVIKRVFNTDVPISIMGISGNDYSSIKNIIDSLTTRTDDNDLFYVFYSHSSSEDSIDNFFVSADEYADGVIEYWRIHQFLDNQQNRDLFNNVRILLMLPDNNMCIHEQMRLMKVLVDRLLEEKAKKIDIVVYTNSLFIMSDIVTDNMFFFNTFAEDKHSTFGANLYDILNNLSNDNSIGNISSEYCKKIICLKNNNKEIDNKDLDIIGDNLIKNYCKANTY